MNKKLLVLAISALLLTGCSSADPELSYDPVELIEYEKCLNTVPIEYDEVVWRSPGLPEKYCKSKKPILK